MAFHLDWHRNHVVITFTGDTTAEDVHLANERFYSDDRSESIRCSIWDFSAVAGVGEVATSDLEHYAALDLGASLYLQKQKIALVTNSEETRTYCEEYKTICASLGHGWEVELFATIEQALDWCGRVTEEAPTNPHAT